ncbi:mechanosensitive ion channel family protein [Candidatus Nucleicultrix amoebiphila]|jgi:small-conductance mechanosensitive channel|uniref:Mechanosensitive ion channel MscS domain-containing protein n=1 Tax=Candidatus Nucleicultrix amoebiphila FS5 TaxID=1414854 RepID=A0A1W6N4G7_9PROT|nr:mechanosensitive ion channel family protein [Candidatus Nucleicultrix amoebiphila]ARN84658.1 hypothetical protein GQ61_04315 [Candidatus Nucleicultrix amoebiphila FS5]
MSEDVAVHFSSKVINTSIIFIILGVLYLIFLNFIKNKEPETKLKYRKRFLYASGFIILYFVARIWMEGFIHLFAFLGLISAALTITQKETLMNLSGWLIIMWRNLFSEGDRIEIANYTGYVTSIGVFYFTISEYYLTHRKHPTGKIYKIPNGLIIHHPLINYSKNFNLLEYKLTFLLTPKSNLDQFRTLVVKLLDEKILPKYRKVGEKEKIKNFSIDSKVYYHPKFEDPSGIEASVCYYCHPKDHQEIERQSFEELLKILEREKEISLAYASPKQVELVNDKTIIRDAKIVSIPGETKQSQKGGGPSA